MPGKSACRVEYIGKLSRRVNNEIAVRSVSFCVNRLNILLLKPQETKQMMLEVVDSLECRLAPQLAPEYLMDKRLPSIVLEKRINESLGRQTISYQSQPAPFITRFLWSRSDDHCRNRNREQVST